MVDNSLETLFIEREKVLKQQDLHPLNGTLATKLRKIEADILEAQLTDNSVCDRLQILEE